MLPVYLDEISDDLIKIINCNINEMFYMFFDLAEGSDESFEYSISIVFPDHYCKNKDKCKEVLYDLRHMNLDRYKRNNLKPLYEYILYHLIVWWFEVVDEGIRAGDITFKTNFKGYKYRNEDEKYWMEKIDDPCFYLENMFQDFYFLDVPEFVEAYRINPELAEKALPVFLIDYVDLIPDDIKEELNLKLADHLSKLKEAIDNFERILNENCEGQESIFHDFLKDNSILLDVYGDPVSKPRFYYPDKGTSTLNKKYVEPDFIIKYLGNKYKLVELERPNKKISTIQGQPRSGVGQSTFQIAEWKSYIYNHYNLIEDRFPGISNPTNCSSMVVISRATKESFLCRNEIQYMELVNLQFSCEIIVYDDLLKRAKQAYNRLSLI